MESTMDFPTMLIWMLRILLPIILFFVYHKLQSQGDGKSSRKSGFFGGASTGGPRYERKELLARREETLDFPAPQAVAEIKTQERAPSPTNRRGGKGGKGARRESGDRIGNRENSQEYDDQMILEAQKAAELEAKRAADLQERREKQERMYVQSFINHVAFIRSERQRVFLPDGPPPPPPPRIDAACIDQDIIREANLEVHSVLNGAMKLQRAEIVAVIHDSLSERQIEVEKSTYELMVELCLLARDLKLASDYLLKMENAGHAPDADLLDRVMEMYQEQKTSVKEASARRDVDEPVADEESPEISQPPRDDEEVLTATLSAEAPAFVPNTCESKMLSPSALPFVPGVAPTVNEFNSEFMQSNAEVAEAPAPTKLQRTKLKSSSKPFDPNATQKPFEPAFSMHQDQYMYPWPMVDGQNAENLEFPQHMQGQDQYMYNWQMGDDQLLGGNDLPELEIQDPEPS